MANTSADLMMSTLTDIVQYANSTGSVNLYMAHGGTNFGYWAGEIRLHEILFQDVLASLGEVPLVSTWLTDSLLT